MNVDFYPLASKMLHVTINMAAARENMGDIEREIRGVKERGRATLNTPSLRALTKWFIVKLVYFTALWSNNFPENTVIYKVYSPRYIISGQNLSFKPHFRMDFGYYSEVYYGPSPTNSMILRTRKCLGLGTTGNLQGSYKFFDLTTGKKLKKLAWTPIPMPDAIIKRLEYLVAQELRSGSSGGCRFCNRNREIYAYRNEGDDEEPLIKK